MSADWMDRISALEQDTLHEIRKLIDECGKLTVQRDELLVVLETIVNSGDWFDTALEFRISFNGHELEKLARAILAKVKEQKP